ncbi:MAG TPA: hypothetical protein VHY08_22950 [Bacillota bacterium]|nr:hypothetical protein [Bacillota bacterium]
MMRIFVRFFSLIIFSTILMIFLITGCETGGKRNPLLVPKDGRLIFLLHSTGGNLWNDGGVVSWFDQYNIDHGTGYSVEEQWYSRAGNYPYDFWYDWCHEDNLDGLASQYQVIVWKHCFPVSQIEESSAPGDVASEQKTIANYKLQYNALKAKMRSFSNNIFIVWTGAVCKQGEIDVGQAQRTKDFFDWVRSTWDESGDNIFLWDFYYWETDGTSLYLKDEYATDSHPNTAFNQRVAPYFCRRVVNVIQGNGDTTSIQGN